MTRAFIGIGSNIDPTKNVRAAIRSLAQQTHLVGISMVYCTDALDRPEQPPYYNCVVAIETEVPPAEVKHGILHPIENSLGRKRTGDKYAPRTIDLDLIVYGDLAMDEEGIKLPDPAITFAAHRGYHAELAQQLLVITGTILTTPARDHRLRKAFVLYVSGRRKIW